jgi:hypothetical protein
MATSDFSKPAARSKEVAASRHCSSLKSAAPHLVRRGGRVLALGPLLRDEGVSLGCLAPLLLAKSASPNWN